jgi:hypothetical protein
MFNTASTVSRTLKHSVAIVLLPYNYSCSVSITCSPALGNSSFCNAHIGLHDSPRADSADSILLQIKRMDSFRMHKLL